MPCYVLWTESSLAVVAVRLLSVLFSHTPAEAGVYMYVVLVFQMGTAVSNCCRHQLCVFQFMLIAGSVLAGVGCCHCVTSADISCMVAVQ